MIHVPTLRTSLLRVATLSLLLSLAGNAAAQESHSDSLSVILEPITVEATHSSITMDRAPLSVTKLYRSTPDLVARRAATMDELTFTLPGVWVKNRENHALGESMTVRGMGWRSQFGVRGIQVVLDDIPLTVADGQTILNMVDPAMVNSLEILRGPSATFWGNSSGGVLYMRTRPSADSPRFMLRSYGGSFGTMKHELRWHDQIGGVRWGGYGSYYNTDGYRDYSAAELIRGGLSAGFNLSQRSNLEARIAYAGMPNAEHPGSLSKEEAASDPTKAWPFNVNTGSGKEFHQLMGAATWLQEFDSGILTVTGHGTWRDFVNPLPGPYIVVDRLAGGSRAVYDFHNLPFGLQIGGELKWQRDDREQYNNVGGQRGDNQIISQRDNVSNQALFARIVWDVDRFTFSAGVRGDRMAFSADSIDTATGNIIAYTDQERVFTTINPSLGVNYNLGDARLYANFSTSFEAPTTTEFKNRLDPTGTSILPGFNPDLDPERAIGIEAGVRGILSGSGLEYDLAVYRQFVEDQIIQQTEIDGQAIFSNGGKADHYGVETHFRYRPVSLLSLELMYTWTYAAFGEGEFEEDYQGNRLPGVAPHRIGSGISLYLGDHMVSTDLEWVSEYYVNSANTVSNDPYFLVNARWTFQGLRFDGWRVQPFVSVYNVLDERYNTSVAINNAAGRFFEPGAGRSFQAGLSVQF